MPRYRRRYPRPGVGGHLHRDLPAGQAGHGVQHARHRGGGLRHQGSRDHTLPSSVPSQFLCHWLASTDAELGSEECCPACRRSAPWTGTWRLSSTRMVTSTLTPMTGELQHDKSNCIVCFKLSCKICLSKLFIDFWFCQQWALFIEGILYLDIYQDLKSFSYFILWIS